jgi:hypothetical protein
MRHDVLRFRLCKAAWDLVSFASTNVPSNYDQIMGTECMVEIPAGEKQLSFCLIVSLR